MSELRVVAAAIVDDGRVLCARRGVGGADAGLWELPGGKVEVGEADADALVREIEEELAVTIEVTGPLGASLLARPGRDLRLVAYWCRLVRGTPVALEHQEIRWCDADACGALDWAPADVPLVSAVVAALRRDV